MRGNEVAGWRTWLQLDIRNQCIDARAIKQNALKMLYIIRSFLVKATTSTTPDFHMHGLW